MSSPPPTASDRPVVRAEDAKDAERLEWLFDHVEGLDRCPELAPSFHFMVEYFGDLEDDSPTQQAHGSTLRGAIDAAMSADRAAPPSGDDHG